MRALEDQALDKATTRARRNAEVLAKGMGVHLGTLVYVTNQVSVIKELPLNGENFIGLTQLGGRG